MKLRLGVLFGGASVEHEISILTAMQAMDHLNKDTYEIIPMYFAKDQTLYQGDACQNLENYKDLDGLVSKLEPISLYTKNGKTWMHFVSKRWKKDKEIDLLLPLMHGTYGEDGSVQGFLRMINASFCGSDLAGGVIGQDKMLMKQVLESNHLPVVPWVSFHSASFHESMLENVCRSNTWPMIIKPAHLGSSIGIHMAHDRKELLEGIEDAFRYDACVIVEQAVSNLREFNCAVLGDEDSRIISCVEEVHKEDEILSYHDKYEGGGKSKGMVSASRKIPANISDEWTNRITKLAEDTFVALQASGVARIDFLSDGEQIYVNEINTLPGSLSFYLFEPLSISFTQLLDMLIEMARKRQRKQSQRIVTYPTNVLSSFQNGCKYQK